MANVQILSWLNSRERNFSLALNLLEKYSSNTLLLKMARLSGDTKFNREKIIQEFVKINAESVEKEEPKGAKTLSDELYQAAPNEVHVLVARQKELYKINAREMATLSAWFEEAVNKFGERNDDKINSYLLDRGSEDKVHEILERRDEMDVIHEKLEFYQRYKKLPEEIAIEKSLDDDAISLSNSLRNIRSNISKLKNKNKPDELASLIKQRDMLERRLNDFI